MLTSFDTVLPIYGNEFKEFDAQVYNDDYLDVLKYCLYITIAITAVLTSIGVVSVIYAARAHAQSVDIIMASDSPKESDKEKKKTTNKTKISNSTQTRILNHKIIFKIAD